uniref:Uncharacterized protein n=1 Tax=Chromera velia CCMP2878 TaxID=1169474 RepID=A0A0G4HW22_9ALVE|eukprot:Cvel_32428.t1-p1 / transcript=Cvel_32428.t1 / gene=Cvel_32428 / organism=Chromera_velia_CCMP2878 / gene_product=hypothetical protein / transcript_product=hypothetical protein / location=Cvel_scaffold5043:5061-5657(+) / protein_length=155 / sequence_SO=supercontig / SO=protein_coding / is_pseudo=false
MELGDIGDEKGVSHAAQDLYTLQKVLSREGGVLQFLLSSSASSMCGRKMGEGALAEGGGEMYRNEGGASGEKVGFREDAMVDVPVGGREGEGEGGAAMVNIPGGGEEGSPESRQSRISGEEKGGEDKVEFGFFPFGIASEEFLSLCSAGDKKEKV